MLKVTIKKFGRKITAKIPYHELDKIPAEDRFAIMDSFVGGDAGLITADDITESFVITNTI